jgi:hypothetical protein
VLDGEVGVDAMDTFDPSLFSDPVLSRTGSPEGMRADVNAHAAANGRRLRGMHALYEVDEVALIAVPDSVHPTWALAEQAPPTEFIEEEVAEEDPCAGSFSDCSDDDAPADADDDSLPPSGVIELAPVAGGVDRAALVRVHRDLSLLCEARRDVVAVLALPLEFEMPECEAWLREFRQARGLPGQIVSGSGEREVADLSFVTAVHPWLITAGRSGDGAPPAVPADGAACGLYARRERARGPWISPANQPLRDVLSLVPRLSSSAMERLHDLQFCVYRREPRDYRLANATTLSNEESLGQASVRRLIIYLRKEVLRRAQDWLFAPNDEELQEDVREELRNLLERLFELGAFAGATVEESLRVEVGQELDPLARGRGELLLRVLVAPSRPLEFLEVRIVRQGRDMLWATED